MYVESARMAITGSPSLALCVTLLLDTLALERLYGRLTTRNVGHINYDKIQARNNCKTKKK